MVPDGQDHPSIAALRRGQEFLQAFPGPVAAVWGERDPILGRVAGWIETLRPDVAMTRTPAGHFLQEEVPEAVAAAITSTARAARLAPGPSLS
jgi:haloalkane dehalogenase